MTYSALAIPRLTSSDTSASAISQNIGRRQHPHQLRRATERTLGSPYGDAPARKGEEFVDWCHGRFCWPVVQEQLPRS
jgi:hypothetical protein